MELPNVDPTVLIAAIINIGSAIAVIYVVDRFLKFIKEMNLQNSDTSKQLAEVITKLTGRVESLETAFNQHDATEMEFLRSVVGNMDRKTQPRGKGQ